MLAQDFLHSSSGPCVALETVEGRFMCGLVRNPLGYLFKAAHPEMEVPVLEAPPAVKEGYQLSVNFAAALGIGMGCDADDDEKSAAWAQAFYPRPSE
jgi:hypothetical protein